MNTSEELAGISLTALKDLTNKFMEVMQEILKAVIVRSTQDTDKARPGKNKVEKLLTGGNRLNAPIKLDQQDVDKFYRLASEHHIPVSVIKSGNEFRAFFRENDLGMVSHFMKDMLVQKMEVDKDKQKEIVLDNRVEAKQFKNRAIKANVPHTFYDTEGGKVKVAFYEQDIDKVKIIISDLKAAQDKNARRSYTVDKAKDAAGALITNKDSIRVYDADLNKNVKMTLPITKNAFVKNLRAAFGYTEKEALDVAIKVEEGKPIDGYSTKAMFGEEKWIWKPDYKEMYSQVEKLEKSIELSNDANSLKGYGFSTLTLADGKNTNILTVSEDLGTKSYSTQPIDKATFVSEAMEKLGISESIANDMQAKAAQLGYINDGNNIALNIPNAKNIPDYIKDHFKREIKDDFKPSDNPLIAHKSRVDAMPIDRKISYAHELERNASFCDYPNSAEQAGVAYALKQLFAEKYNLQESLKDVDLKNSIDLDKGISVKRTVDKAPQSGLASEKELLSAGIPVYDPAKDGLAKYGMSVVTTDKSLILIDRNGYEIDLDKKGVTKQLQYLGFENDQIKELAKDKVIGSYIDESTGSTSKAADITVDKVYVAKSMVDKEFSVGVGPDGNKTYIVDSKYPRNYVYINRPIEEVRHETFGVVDYASIYKNNKRVYFESEKGIDKTKLYAAVSKYKEPVILSQKEFDAIKEAPTFESYEINKSAANSTVTFAYNGKVFKADLSNTNDAISGLRSTFNLSSYDAIGLIDKAQKQGVNETIKSAVKKATAQDKTRKPKDVTKSKDQSAR
jgi:hypothetical protein